MTAAAGRSTNRLPDQLFDAMATAASQLDEATDETGAAAPSVKGARLLALAAAVLWSRSGFVL